MNIKEFLNRVSLIKNRCEEAAGISGENFNVFNILNLTSDELSHSRIIAMLLNPKGDHGMGSLFLRRFLETTNVECIGIDFSGAVVEREKPIEGGRPDIVITTNVKEIIIENKIYAQDQGEQLSRYSNYNKDAVLLYLILDGHPSKSAKEDTHYHRISYKEHILKWLEICIRESENNTFLWGTISQYVLLVKQLTGQSGGMKWTRRFWIPSRKTRTR